MIAPGITQAVFGIRHCKRSEAIQSSAWIAASLGSSQ
jgi:hypothetical protein